MDTLAKSYKKLKAVETKFTKSTAGYNLLHLRMNEDILELKKSKRDWHNRSKND